MSLAVFLIFFGQFACWRVENEEQTYKNIVHLPNRKLVGQNGDIFFPFGTVSPGLGQAHPKQVKQGKSVIWLISMIHHQSKYQWRALDEAYFFVDVVVDRGIFKTN